MFVRSGNGFPKYPTMDSKVLRPMMTGCPWVSRLKRLRSSGMCQRSFPSLPNSRFFPMATTAQTRGCISLHDHLRLYRRVALVIFEPDILHSEAVDVLHLRVEPKLGERHRFARELFFHGIEVFVIHVRVLQGQDALLRLESRHLREHMQEERIRGDVEGYAQEHIATSLHHVERKCPVGHEALEKQIARRERHIGKLARVPCAHDG